VSTGDADRGADRVGLGRHVVTADRRGAAVGADQGGQDLDRGGLAGAVGAEQGENRSPRHVQVDAVEDYVVTERLAQPGRHDGRMERRGGGHGISFPQK
jgi:hypothetical protein